MSEDVEKIAQEIITDAFSMKEKHHQIQRLAVNIEQALSAERTKREELEQQLKKCGKENCMGHEVDGVASWVRKERLEEAQKEIKALHEITSEDEERIKILEAGKAKLEASLISMKVYGVIMLNDKNKLKAEKERLQSELNQLKSKTVNPVDFHRLEEANEGVNALNVELLEIKRGLEKELAEARKEISRLAHDVSHFVKENLISKAKVERLTEWIKERGHTKRCRDRIGGTFCVCGYDAVLSGQGEEK